MAQRKPHAQAAQDLLLTKGLPCNLQAEQVVLGSILLNDSLWDKAAEILSQSDFTLESHRRIWAQMAAIHEQGERIDAITLANALMDAGHLESVGGLTFLSSLTEGLPEVPNLSDYAGIVKEKSDLRTLIFASQRTIDLAMESISGAQEIAADVVSKFTTNLLSRETASEDGRRPEQIVTNFPGGLSAFIDPTLRRRGLPTGFRKLDEMLGGGLQDGELIILAARPAVGKSSYAINICQHISLHPKHPQRTDVFSLEMSGESLITRMLCAAARVDQHKFRAGFLSTNEREALQKSLYKIMSSPIRIHDDFRKTLPGLVRRVRHAHKEGSKLIAIDYIQLMVTGARSENRNLEIGEIGRTLKLLALELQMPILLLSQIGRSAEKRGGDMRPQLSDLKDSGTLEENADTVLALYRAELYAKDRTDVQGLADLDILKQRSGPCGRIPLRFIGAWTSFENRSEDMDFPEEEQEPEPMRPMSGEDW